MSLCTDRPTPRIAGCLQGCLLALALTACAGAAEAGASGKPLLWEVKSSSSSVYVLGSMHVATPDFYPLAKPVEDFQL